jgi:hypothetical protein
MTAMAQLLSLQETAALPSAVDTQQRHYCIRQRPSANFSSEKGFLPSAFYWALGKDFAECLREPLAKKSCRDNDFLTNGCFAECLLEGHSAVPSPEALGPP